MVQPAETAQRLCIPRPKRDRALKGDDCFCLPADTLQRQA